MSFKFKEIESKQLKTTSAYGSCRFLHNYNKILEKFCQKLYTYVYMFDINWNVDGSRIYERRKYGV